MELGIKQNNVVDCAALSNLTYKCLFSPVLDRIKHIYSDDNIVLASIEDMRVALGNADKSSPSFLFDISNLIIQNSGLQVNLQESYLRMQAATSDDELELSQFRHIGQFNNLSKRAIALRNILSRIPEEMTSRKIFLKLIKDVASSIKQLLDSLNELIEYLPYTHRPVIEKRKREFVRYSKRFSNTLKDFFKDQDATQVYVAANLLINQEIIIVRTIRHKIML